MGLLSHQLACLRRRNHMPCSMARQASQLHHALPSPSDPASSTADPSWAQQWTRQLTSWLVAAGLALALFIGSSPTADAAIFPFAPPPTAPATLEMKVCLMMGL